MTKTYHWPDLRDRAIHAFNGDTPGAELEARILNHFQETPGRVATLVDAIARKVDAGQVTSGWAILDRELATKAANIQATDNRERTTALRVAEAFITKTGGYIDRQDELEDELFGDRGPLREWPDLKPRIVKLWLEQRPRFEKTEQQADERMGQQAETLTRLRKASMSSLIEGHAENVASEIERVRGIELDAIAATVDLDRPADPPEPEGAP